MEHFIELYQTVYKDLYRLAYYYLGNAQDAEDAVQETALAAYKNFGRLRRQEAFRQWIFRILTNCCRDQLRRNLRRRGQGDYWPGEEPEGAYDPQMSARLELLELLGRLTEEERLIVTLAVFGGYKGEEIAGILKMKHSTVRSKYRRALKKLERELVY